MSREENQRVWHPCQVGIRPSTRLLLVEDVQHAQQRGSEQVHGQRDRLEGAGEVVVDQELERERVAGGRAEQKEGPVAAEVPEEVSEDVAEHGEEAEQVPGFAPLGLPGDGHAGEDGDATQDEHRVPDVRRHEKAETGVPVPLDGPECEVDQRRHEDELGGDEGDRESLPVVHRPRVGRVAP